MNKPKMLCPICKEVLIVTGQARLETLDEHVCDPNGEVSLKDKYQCPKKYCAAHVDGMMWNQWGGYYSTMKYAAGRKYEFIDNNDGAINSFERKLNAESRHDKDFYIIYTKLYSLKFCFDFLADEEGKILKTRWHLETYINSCYYIPGYRMLIHCFRDFYRNVDWYRKICLRTDVEPEQKAKNIEWALGRIREPLNKKWDRRWWRLLTNWYIRTFYRKLIEEKQNEFTGNDRSQKSIVS